MNRPHLKIAILTAILTITSTAQARDWFGGNSFFGNNNDCNDWPEWTPMYWMEEMLGNNDCYYNGYNGGAYGSAYPAPYSYYGRAVSPYARNYAGYPATATNAYSAYGRYPGLAYPQSRLFAGGLPPFSSGFAGSPLTSFPSLGGSPFNQFGAPFSSSAFSSPFAAPFSSPFSSPFGSPITSLSSPMGLGGMSGLGSPFSPMSPMSPMSPLSPISPLGLGGVPGMGLSPMSSLGTLPLLGRSTRLTSPLAYRFPTRPRTPIAPRIPTAPRAPLSPLLGQGSPVVGNSLGLSPFNPFR